MEMRRRGGGVRIEAPLAGSREVALLAGAWNPPTRAHMALAEAARRFAPEVLLALPQALPHKAFEGPDYATRLGWLLKLAESREWMGVAAGGSGLFVDLARGLRAADPRTERIYIVCGGDAAQRFLGWDYTGGASVEEQLKEFDLLVAPRGADFEPPARFRAAVHRLELEARWQTVSSTQLRQRIQHGEPWEHLAPEEIAAQLERAYRPA
ncbi:MAG: hypothetical protein ACLQBJ_05860 [Bryobacteraceae bacterium]